MHYNLKRIIIISLLSATPLVVGHASAETSLRYDPELILHDEASFNAGNLPDSYIFETEIETVTNEPQPDLLDAFIQTKIAEENEHNAAETITEQNNAIEVITEQNNAVEVIAEESNAVKIVPEQNIIVQGHDDLWNRIRNGFNMKNIDSSLTDKHANWYASRPDYVERMLTRSQKYLFHIVKEVEKRGMPAEIALLPMIESAYNPEAYSKSHAAGIWQFIPATGRHFGLHQTYWSDERQNITEATTAALTYLKYLHNTFGSWDLALAAYNAGEGTVSRAIKHNERKNLPTHYAALPLSKETRNYVPKLQAVKNIIAEPYRYGISVQAIANQPYFTTVNAPKQIDAKLVAELAEISNAEFSALNPNYKRPVLISSNADQQILLPTWSAETFTHNLSQYDKPLTTWTTYIAKHGEKVATIANKFSISASKLRKVNNLSRDSRLRSSRPLLVPNKSSEKPKILLAKFNTIPVYTPSKKSHEKKIISYKVKRGDTLSSIARKYKVRSKDIAKHNRIKKSRIKAGQVLKIIKSTSKKSKRRSKKVAKHKKRSSKLYKRSK